MMNNLFYEVSSVRFHSLMVKQVYHINILKGIHIWIIIKCIDI